MRDVEPEDIEWEYEFRCGGTEEVYPPHAMFNLKEPKYLSAVTCPGCEDCDPEGKEE